jgi:hypothetical protein
MKQNKKGRGIPEGRSQPELFNITEGSLIERNEQIITRKPPKSSKISEIEESAIAAHLAQHIAEEGGQNDS